MDNQNQNNNDKKVISEERKIEIWETIQMIGENLVRKKMENIPCGVLLRK